MLRLARRAGIEKRVHAHGFRHTHAAELAMEGKPVNLIQA
jgi:integrase